MASFEHEHLVELFRNRPALAREILRGRPGIRIGRGRAALASIDLSQATSPEYRCDALVAFQRPRAAHPDHATIVEIQLAKDHAKKRSWPAYITIAHARLRCRVTLLVIAPDPAVARWAAAPIVLGHPGFVLTPIVLGLRDLPRITDHTTARAAPELAVISAIAHPEADVARAALAAIVRLPEDPRRLYFEVIMRGLSDAERTAIWEDDMKAHEYKSEFARTYVKQGLEQGLEQGREEGREDTLRQTLRKQLGLKFGAITAETEARIASATPDELDRFLERILSAESVAAVLAPPVA